MRGFNSLVSSSESDRTVDIMFCVNSDTLWKVNPLLMQDFFLLILKKRTKNHSHQLAWCAGNWGSSLDPSSFERDIFNSLKLASISFLMMDNGKQSLKEFSTCYNRNKKNVMLYRIKLFLCFLWTDNIMWMKIKSNKLT